MKICNFGGLFNVNIMYQREVSFGGAIRRALQLNYCNFAGRASRSEYWWYTLFTVIVGFVIGLLFSWSDTMFYIVSGIVNLALILPGLGLSCRRLHDTGRGAGWIFINLVPIVGSIIFVVFCIQPSEPASNRFGPVPNVA